MYAHTPNVQSVHPKDSTKKISRFVIENPTVPHHVAFAVGPFEKVNLTAFREPEDVEALGRNAVDIYAYCLPRREESVRNTCIFMHMVRMHLYYLMVGFDI